MDFVPQSLYTTLFYHWLRQAIYKVSFPQHEIQVSRNVTTCVFHNTITCMCTCKAHFTFCTFKSWDNPSICQSREITKYYACKNLLYFKTGTNTPYTRTDKELQYQDGESLVTSLSESFQQIHRQWENNGRVPLGCNTVECLQVSELNGGW